MINYELRCDESFRAWQWFNVESPHFRSLRTVDEYISTKDDYGSASINLFCYAYKAIHRYIGGYIARASMNPMDAHQKLTR